MVKHIAVVYIESTKELLEDTIQLMQDHIAQNGFKLLEQASQTIDRKYYYVYHIQWNSGWQNFLDLIGASTLFE